MQRIRKQYRRERIVTLNSPFPYVKKYTINKEINVKNKTNEYIRRQIMELKKISKNAEEISCNDIRSFILQNIIVKRKGGN